MGTGVREKNKNWCLDRKFEEDMWLGLSIFLVLIV
jgi:hypothetical protein